jgi:type 1 glutamine amidotransferase
MKSLRLLAFTAASLAAVLNAHAEQFKALLFSKTAGWHHESINAGVTAIRQLGQLHDFDVFWTEDANRVINDKELAKYKVVIFLCTTGDILNPDQQAAFERYIKGGGGFVGIHSGGADTEYDWPWFNQMAGYMFHIHPAVQTATVKVLETDFPGMDRFAKRFLFTEEWYEFGPPKSDKLKFLLAVDEKTYKPYAKWGPKEGKGMGDFHPISWYQEYDGGRAFYTAFGHLPATYSDANFMHHVYGGIYWAATGNGFKAE